ncbi:phosducin-like protein 2 [Melanerpes formicivorus]|uniref:phosducin-like protein 2 n=1 Tax=Melanerpes formicivorus TaxID=211600 RepID=UPI00358F7C33
MASDRAVMYTYSRTPPLAVPPPAEQLQFHGTEDLVLVCLPAAQQTASTLKPGGMGRAGIRAASCDRSQHRAATQAGSAPCLTGSAGQQRPAGSGRHPLQPERLRAERLCPDRRPGGGPAAAATRASAPGQPCSIQQGGRGLGLVEKGTHRTELLICFLILNQDPDEDTEWNDLQRHFGILPPKEKLEGETEEMVLQREIGVELYEGMKLEELREAEADFDEADRKAIEMYRQQRLQAWKCLQRRQKYGELRGICGEQYVREVTNAPEDVGVTLHLCRPSVPTCLLVSEHLSLIARKFPEAKFLQATADSCIQGYQDRCLPTILVCETGEVRGRLIGAAERGGGGLQVEEFEWKLAEVGALETDLEENPQEEILNMMSSSVQSISAPTDTSAKSCDQTLCCLRNL